MPSGVRKDGTTNVELPQCVEAKIKAHKGHTGPTNKINNIIDYFTPLLNNLVNPLDDLYIAIMNLDKEQLIRDLDENRVGSALTKIMYRLNPYLPDTLKVSTYRVFSSFNACDNTKNKCVDFIFNVINAANKIEDKLSRDYYINGKFNKLEILKRRYRNNWGDDKGQKSIEVKQTDKEDKTLEIIIKEV